MTGPLPRILVMEDSIELLAQIREALGESYDLHAARFLEEAKEFLAAPGAILVIIDQELQGVGGVELFRQVRRISPRVRIAMMVDSSDIRTAVIVTKMGAAEVFRKPLDPQFLRSAIARLTTVEEGAVLDYSNVVFPRWMTGGSPVIREFRDQLTRTIPQERDVLVVGDPGTDRESIVSLIHRLGPTRDRSLLRLDVRPFQTENTEAHFWGALRELLQEPEIQSTGNGEGCGVLVLTGVEEIPTHFQESIFQFLQGRFQARESWRVSPNVRVVIELKNPERILAWEKHGWISGFLRLDVPSLDDIREDLAWIIAGAIPEISRRLGRPESTLEPELLEYLMTKPQGGNHQELQNILERAEWWSTRECIGLRDLPISIPDWIDSEVEYFFERRSWNFGKSLEKFERRFLRLVFHKLSSDLDRMSIFLDIPKSQLQDRLEQLGIGSF